MLRQVASAVVVLFAVYSIAVVQAEEVPLTSMSLGDANADLVFTPLSPCRIFDTRLTADGVLAGGTTRNFHVAGPDDFEAQGGNPAGCGVPLTATAVQINFVAVNPLAGGNLRGAAYPNEIPRTGSIINYQALTPNLNIANAVSFPICDEAAEDCRYDISLLANGGGTHVVADALGYYRRFPTEETITEITAGTGLSGGGTSGTVSLSIADGGVDTQQLDALAVTAPKISAAGSSTGQVLTSAGASVIWSDPASPTLYVRTIIVSPGATALESGTTLLNAMTSISDASATNPYLLKIEPGLYDLNGATLTMKEFVDVEGSGQALTKVTSQQSGGATGTVRSASFSELRSLTIESVGGLTNAMALHVSSSVNFTIRGVTLEARNAAQTYGIDVNGPSSTRLDGVVIDLSGEAGDNLAGINQGSSSATLVASNLTINASSAGSVNGILGFGSVDLEDVKVSIAQSSSARGLVLNFLATTARVNRARVQVVSAGQADGINWGGRLELTNSEVTVQSPQAIAVRGSGIISGKVSNCDLTSIGSPTAMGIVTPTNAVSDLLRIEHSRIEASGTTVSGDPVSALVQIGGSRLSGAAVVAVYYCAGNWDEAFTFFPSTCP